MSEITRCVIGMPFHLAMSSELSRRQFYSIAQALFAENETLRQNAARYLHIREHSYVEVVCESPRVSRWAPERLDALVDAEMAKGVNHG
jgi:hypothetical protein